MTTVTLRSLVKDYGEVRAIHGVDLEIPDGAFTVLAGPSGCAKSKLLGMFWVRDDPIVQLTRKQTGRSK